jgi:hypothetical protein
MTIHLLRKIGRASALACVCGTLLLLLPACGNAEEARAIAVADMTAFIEEETAIAATLTSRGTAVFATAVAAQTRMIDMEGMNGALVSTLRAAVPPTRQIVDNSGLVTPGMNAPLPGAGTPAAGGSASVSPETAGENQLVDVAIALGVRESDSCATQVVSTVSSSTLEIYGTGRILNARLNTVVDAVWSYEGQPVFTNNAFTIPRDDPSFCVYFFIEPTDVPFSPGNWSFQFRMNGQPSGPVATFILQ